jgi:hypothetical protein
VWHHFGVTFDKGDITIYLDGVRDPAMTVYYDSLPRPVVSSTLFTNSSVSLDKFRIGTAYNYCGADGFVEQFDGAMDDIRIYDYALSSNEVSELFALQAAPPPTDGDLVLHYTFDSDEGVIVSDQTTNGWDATVSSTLWISNGVHGGGLEFDSAATSHLYLDSAEILNDREAFTISTWFRANDPSVNQTIMMVGGRCPNERTPDLGVGTVIRLVDGGHFDARVVGGTGTGSDPANATRASNSVVDTGWHHFGVTFNAGDITIYLDGVRDPAMTVYFDALPRPVVSSTLFTNSSVSLDKFRIGTAYNYCGADGYVEQFDGAMDDVRIYDGALSDQEVEALFDETRPSPPPPPPPTPNDLLLHYAFNADNGAQVVDESEYNRTGTAIGGTWVEEGVSGGAYSFNGVSDYIYAGQVISNLTSYTVSAWVKLNRFTHERYMGILGQQEFVYPAPNLPYYMFYVSPIQGFGTLATWSNADAFDSRATHALPLHTWRWVVQTYDGTNVMQYDDGVLVNTVAASGKTLHSDSALLIGKVGGYPGYLSVNYFAGEMDDIKIYSRAMSAQEIADGFMRGIRSTASPVEMTFRPGANPDFRTLSMRWPGRGAGYVYALEETSNLTHTVWNLVAPTNQWPVFGNSWTGAVPNIQGVSECYFRVRSWPTP